MIQWKHERRKDVRGRGALYEQCRKNGKFGLELGTTEVAFVKAWHTKEYGPCIQPCGPVEATYVVVSASTRNRSAWFTVPGQNKDTARAMGFWRMYHEKLTRNYGADHYILPIGYTYLAEGTLPKGVRVVSRSREMRQLGISGVAYIDQKKADELRGKYQAIFDAEDEEICARVERRSRSEAARAEVIAIAQPYFERLDKAGSKDRYSAGTDELVLVGTENLAYHDPDFEQKLRAFTDAQEKQYTAHQKAVKEWRSFRDEWREKFKPFTDRLDEKGYSYTYDDSWSNWLRDRERGMKLMMDGVSYPYADYGIRKLRGDM